MTTTKEVLEARKIDLGMVRFLSSAILENAEGVAEICGLDEEQTKTLRAFFNWVSDHGLEYALEVES